MAIRSKINLFAGINPILNNALQQKGGDWRSFHSYHIIHIAQYLNEYLPDAYYARPEKSLQIGTYDGEALPIRKSAPQSDILVTYEELGTIGQNQSGLEIDMPVMTLPMTQYIEPEDELDGLVIYSERSGKAVTRIELLSPANMPHGSHHSEYLRKRYQTLKSGVRLVEIDYLHESEPISEEIPSYRQDEKHAFPYHIIVSDPRPTFESGETEVYSFGIFDKLPTIKMPLEDADNMAVPFTTIYQNTYSERPFWRSVNYEQEPIHMESFTAADQQAIRNKLRQIAQEQA